MTKEDIMQLHPICSCLVVGGGLNGSHSNAHYRSPPSCLMKEKKVLNECSPALPLTVVGRDEMAPDEGDFLVNILGEEE